uniref:Cyanocobalamin reductase (cyanide-eliminating) n=1 Tax=Trichobilharzia regenti TaxID=157069 RepID=A0AA85JF09_TRIRE|nr:unnamed protein product [Trichobilharzia regenti]
MSSTLQEEEDNLQLSQCLLDELSQQLLPYGFDASPFLSGWYNAAVSRKVQLGKDLTAYDDCLCICLISNPQMFEKTFIPTICEWFKQSEGDSFEEVLKRMRSKFSRFKFPPGSSDPFDWAVFIRLQKVLEICIANIKSQLPSNELDKFDGAQWIPDYAIRLVTRLPYVHVQTAGHVSGMAYFHQPSEMIKQRSREQTGQPYCGVSLHPKYGGWFGFRGIYIFPNLRCPNLPKSTPLSYFTPSTNDGFNSSGNNNSQLEALLYEYNECWSDNKWREYKLFNDNNNNNNSDCNHRYSNDAILYFSTEPSERVKFVQQWFNRYLTNATPIMCTIDKDL